MIITPELAQAIYNHSVANGLRGRALCFAAERNAMHSEVCEAYEAAVSGDVSNVLPGVTAFAEELADVYIVAVGLWVAIGKPWRPAQGDLCNERMLHARVNSIGTRGDDHAAWAVTTLLRSVETTAAFCEIDLAAAIAAKHAHNKTRPYGHVETTVTLGAEEILAVDGGLKAGAALVKARGWTMSDECFDNLRGMVERGRAVLELKAEQS